MCGTSSARQRRLNAVRAVAREEPRLLLPQQLQLLRLLLLLLVTATVGALVAALGAAAATVRPMVQPVVLLLALSEAAAAAATIPPAPARRGAQVRGWAPHHVHVQGLLVCVEAPLRLPVPLVL